MHWLPIVAMVIVANLLFGFAMEGAKRALQDWGAAYARRSRSHWSSSPST
jgi:hypothetical protein